MVNTIDSLSPAPWAPTPARHASPMLDALRRWWRARRQERSARQAPGDAFADLAEIDAHLLADIGAPDHLLGRAMARREMQRQERAGLHLGLASGAWHHW